MKSEYKSTPETGTPIELLLLFSGDCKVHITATLLPVILSRHVWYGSTQLGFSNWHGFERLEAVRVKLMPIGPGRAGI